MPASPAREASTLLEDEELDHDHLVDVGSSSSLGVVGVEALNDGSEGCPVHLGVCFGELVT